MVTTDEHLQALREVGYTVLPGLYSPDYVSLCRSELDRIHEALGRPTLRGEGKQQLAEYNGILSTTGLTIAHLLKNAPALIPGFLHPTVLAILRAALGDKLRIETTGATISDSHRAMHTWHNHVGGLDEDLPLAEQPGGAADPASIRRVSFLLYLDELRPETGQLLVYPRELGSPDPCPFPRAQREPWPGQVAVSCPAGTAVIIEERTWHASLARQTPGLRRFVASWLASDRTPRSRNVDPSVPLFEDAALHRAVAAAG